MEKVQEGMDIFAKHCKRASKVQMCPTHPHSYYWICNHWHILIELHKNNSQAPAKADPLTCASLQMSKAFVILRVTHLEGGGKPMQG